MQQQASTLRIMHLTDPHLFAQAEGRLLGMDTRQSFHAVLAAACQSLPKPDLILATGDIAQDHKALSYQYFLEHTRPIAPVYWLAGNHDDWPVMQAQAMGLETAHRVIDLGNWRIIMLNSSVPGRVHGEISTSELAFLRQELQCSAEHILVCCHHHPVPMGARWIDQIGVRNGEELLTLLHQHGRVRMLLWGHVHQSFDQQQDGIHLACTPSTCIQFKPQSPDFGLDDQGPGWRYIELTAEGRIQTQVHRLNPEQFHIDRQATGY